MDILGIITGVLGIALAIYSIYTSKKSDRKISRGNEKIFELLLSEPQIESKGISNNKKNLTERAGKILEYLKKHKTAAEEDIESFLSQPFENLKDDVNFLRNQGLINVNVIFTTGGGLALSISLVEESSG